MITAVCCAIAVLAAGAALAPAPRARRPDVAPPNAGGPGDPPAARRRRPTARARRLAVTPGSVAVWCEQLARAVRAGDTLGAAIRSTAAPAAIEPRVEGIRLTLDRGGRLVDALAAPSGSSHLDLALAVLRACALHGGPAAEPLDRAAATLRTRAADLADRATHSAQARLSAIVMTLLPIGMLLLLVATSATTRAAVQTPIGAGAVGAGALLNLIGWRWMRRVIDGGGP
ncbi:MAG: hypothetical protein HKN41_09085 [Ilumatobacter sp.]|nr:hypothetical protein [Ilumatobacter sp.]